MEVQANPFQPIIYDSLLVEDFSGGITDNYVGGATNRYRIADNLVILKYGNLGKLKLRFGSEIFDEAHPLLDSVNTPRISALKYFGDAILGFCSNKVRYQNTSGVWTELVGPNGGNSVFTTASDGTNIVSFAEWQNHLLVGNDNYEYISKIYKNSAGAYQIRTAGLPALISSPVLSGNTGSDSFLYRFCYKYSYFVGTVEYIDRGALKEVSLTSVASVNTANPVSISGIPALSNTANTTLWDTTNLGIEIYRTTNGGTKFFLVKSVTNGTLSTSDTMTDATLQLQEVLYTEGEIVERDPVPKAAIVHIVDDTSIAYYARLKEGTELRVNRLQQSVPGDVDGCPEDFTLDVGDEIIAVSSHQGRPILACKNSAYRVDGAYDLFGRGGMTAQRISDRADCVSAQSIVQTNDGVFWCGSEYFYFSDGYKVIQINAELTERHQEFTLTADQRKKIQGKYDRRNNRVVWAVQTTEGGTDTDTCYVLHLEFGISKDSPFTTMTGGASFRPTAIEFVGNTMYRGDEDSYLYLHSEDLFTDPVKQVGVSVSSWAEQAIMFEYESCAYNFGKTQLRKIAPRIVVTCLNESNVPLSIVSINDTGRLEETLKTIRFSSNITWGDPDIEWGDPDIIWNQSGILEQQRNFPRRSYRFSHKQIRMENAYVVITSSAVNGECTTNTTTKAVSIASGAFPSRAVGYFISFETDSFVREFEITGLNSANDTVTVSDANNLLPESGSGTLEWIVRGYPKDEDFGLLSYSIDWAFLGKTQSPYRKGSTGEIL